MQPVRAGRGSCVMRDFGLPGLQIVAAISAGGGLLRGADEDALPVFEEVRVFGGELFGLLFRDVGETDEPSVANGTDEASRVFGVANLGLGGDKADGVRFGPGNEGAVGELEPGLGYAGGDDDLAIAGFGSPAALFAEVSNESARVGVEIVPSPERFDGCVFGSIVDHGEEFVEASSSAGLDEFVTHFIPRKIEGAEGAFLKAFANAGEVGLPGADIEAGPALGFEGFDGGAKFGDLGIGVIFTFGCRKVGEAPEDFAIGEVVIGDFLVALEPAESVGEGEVSDSDKAGE